LFLFQYSFFLLFFTLYILLLAILILYFNLKGGLSPHSSDPVYIGLRKAVGVMKLVQLSALIFVVGINKKQTARLLACKKGYQKKKEAAV